jgi:hypothetical protein
MSDGYKELDLDNPGKASKEEASDIEIVHEGLEPNEVEIAPEAEAPTKAASEPEADDDDD